MPPTSVTVVVPSATPVACPEVEPSSSRVQLSTLTPDVLPSQQIGDQNFAARIAGEAINESNSSVSDVTVAVCIAGAMYEQAVSGVVQPQQTIPYRIEIPDLPPDAEPVVVVSGLRDSESPPVDLPVTGAQFNPPSVERDGLASVTGELQNTLPLEVQRVDIWVTIYKPDGSVREVVQESDVIVDLGIGETTPLDVLLPTVRTLPQGSEVGVRVVATETRESLPTPTPVPTRAPPTPPPTPTAEPLFAVPEGFVGQWAGLGSQLVDQTDSNEDVRINWPLSMTIEPGARGEVVGNVTYPTLGCESRLTLSQVTEETIGVYEELERTSDGCDPTPGLMEITWSSENILFFTWNSDDGENHSSGTLWPVGPLPDAYVGDLSGARPENGEEVEFVLTLVGGFSGEVVGSATYPTLGCSNALVLVRVEPTAIQLFEDNLEDGNGCPEGVLELELDPDGTIFMPA